MAPPKFGDLGKEVRDLIDKNFHFGLVKLEATTKAANGMEITAGGTHNAGTGGVVPGLEVKQAFPDYGLSYSEKWSSNYVIDSSVSFEGKILKGCKADLETKFAPHTGFQAAKVNLSYADCDFLHATAGLDCNFPGLMLNGSGVLAYKGWHAGYEGSYDVSSSKLAASNISLTYSNEEFALHSSVTDNTQYTGSVHHKVSDKLSTGALLQWTAGSSTSSLTVCGNYQIDSDSHLKAKLDNQLNLGVSYGQKVGPGVEMTLSGLVNAKSLEQGGHKLGLSLNFNA